MGRGLIEPGAMGVWTWTRWSPGIFGGVRLCLGVPSGECRCFARSRRHGFIFRPQKDLAMDEEGVQKPTGPPTRKKFLIPVDEDEVPPPAVGLRDGGTAGRLGGWLGGRGTRRGLWDHSVG